MGDKVMARSRMKRKRTSYEDTGLYEVVTGIVLYIFIPTGGSNGNTDLSLGEVLVLCLDTYIEGGVPCRLQRHLQLSCHSESTAFLASSGIS